jgi:signal peptidase I
MKNWMRANKGFLLFLALFGIFRTAVADWNPIPSASMHPNLLEGDVVFVNRLAYNVKLPLTDIVLSQTGEPQRGDIVTFSSPVNGTRLIKRVIALPGDRVEMRNEQLIINGQPARYSTRATAPKTSRAWANWRPCASRNRWASVATPSSSCRRCRRAAILPRSWCRPAST